MKFERKLVLLALLAALPGTAVAILFLLTFWEPPGAWVISTLLVLCWIAGTLALRHHVVRPLQTLANLLAGLRQEDFSTRASGACSNDALGEVYFEMNTLSRMLQDQRLGAMEATALLRTVMQNIDVAVFTFDEQQRLKLVNKSGERLLGRPAERVLDSSAPDLGLAEFLEGENPRTVYVTLPGGTGRWSIKRGVFRQGGAQRHLLVMADLSRALREEERQAWQRLVRVLGHEINNSLAPIKSISTSLAQLVARDPLPQDWKEDAKAGLDIIASRSEALGRFMAAYTQLARLPQPSRRTFEFAPWIQRIAAMETRVPVVVQPGPELSLEADSDQLEQVIINLLRNAADAATESNAQPRVNPSVTVSWSIKEGFLEVAIEDNGPGLASTGNVFVPFFTTKKGGSGIGLVLSRQIAEAHNGTLSLQNRSEGSGCVALLLLPL